MTKKTSPTLALSWRPIIYIAAVLLVCVVIAPQVSGLRDGFLRLQDANIMYFGLACLSVVGAVIASGGTYVYLALKRVPFGATILVQAAGMFVNRLLPAGVGGMGLNARYLYVHKHTLAQASTVALMNNLLTGVGHFLLLVLAVGFLGINFPEIQTPRVSFGFILLSLALFVAIVLIIGRQSALAKRVKGFLNDIVRAFTMYTSRPFRLSTALLFAMGNTLGHTLALYCCMLAFGVDESIGVSLLVLTGGIAAASVTPTPGGVVGAEAGLAAGLVGFSVDAPTAVAAAVSYRIASYWLPLLPGALAFFYIQRSKFI